MGNGLDVEKTPVGLKADLPQSGQVLEFFANAEVACVVDGGFGAEGAALLVILLDAGVFVIDMPTRSAAAQVTLSPDKAGHLPCARGQESRRR